jgi:hypothetical protein
MLQSAIQTQTQTQTQIQLIVAQVLVQQHLIQTTLTIQQQQVRVKSNQPVQLQSHVLRVVQL